MIRLLALLLLGVPLRAGQTASHAGAAEPIAALRLGEGPAIAAPAFATAGDAALRPGLPGAYAEAPAAAPQLQPLFAEGRAGAPVASAAQPGSLSAIMSDGQRVAGASSGELSRIVERSAAEASAAFEQKPNEAVAAEMASLARTLRDTTVDGEAGAAGVRLQQLITDDRRSITPEVEQALRARVEGFIGVLAARADHESGKLSPLSKEHYVEAGGRYLPRVGVRAAFSAYERLASLRPDLVAPQLSESWFRFRVAGVAGLDRDRQADWLAIFFARPRLADAPGTALSLWAFEQIASFFAALPPAARGGDAQALERLNEARHAAARQRDLSWTRGLGGTFYFSVATGLIIGILSIGITAMIVGPEGADVSVLYLGAAASAAAALATAANATRPLRRGLRRILPRLQRSSRQAESALLDRFVAQARGRPVVEVLTQIAAIDESGRWVPLKGYEAEFSALADRWEDFRRVVAKP